jgi:CheY-like chemotaxis protein
MGPLRILVVEDDAMIAMLFEELLRTMGHQVCASVASEGAAIIAARALAPDLMIVDERLSPGSGITAMHIILTTGHIPHVYVPTDETRVREAFPHAVIVCKPFRESDLVTGMGLALAAPPVPGSLPLSSVSENT